MRDRQQWCIIHDMSCDVLPQYVDVEIFYFNQRNSFITFINSSHSLIHSFAFKEVGSIDHALETKSSRITQDNSLHSKV